LLIKFGEREPIRVYRTKVGNALVIESPELIGVVDTKAVREMRTVKDCHWEKVGTGQKLQVETILKDDKGESIPLSAARLIVEHTGNIVVNDKGEDVDKDKIEDHILNPDGSIGERTAPFPPTDYVEITEEDWIPSTAIEEFQIHEEYELPALNPDNDPELFEIANKAAKQDEIAIKPYSNGGYSQYYAFFVPIFKEGKFVWAMKLSSKKIEYRSLRDIPAPDAAQALREIKTVKALPAIQTVITIQKKKPAAK
jgi:hypothetical protein